MLFRSQIVLEIPEEALKAARTEQVAMNRAAQSMATALQSLTLAATTAEGWDDMTEARALYDEAEAALKVAQADYAARLEAEALPLVKQTTDEIAAQYAAGIDFKTLISRYSTDKTERNVNGDGYPFHPDSKMWPESFIKAASALEKVGGHLPALRHRAGRAHTVLRRRGACRGARADRRGAGAVERRRPALLPDGKAERPDRRLAGGLRDRNPSGTAEILID